MDNLLKKIEELEAERIKILEFIRPHQAKLSAIGKELSELREIRDTNLAKEIKASGRLNWDLILKGETGSMSLFREQERQVNSLGLGVQGYFPETGQTAFKIALTKGDPDHTRKVFDSLCVLLPKIKPIQSNSRHSTKAGKLFHIFEHNLSQYEVYNLRVDGDTPDSTCALVKLYSPEIKFPDLMTALKYIEENHWYEDKSEEP